MIKHLLPNRVNFSRGARLFVWQTDCTGKSKTKHDRLRRERNRPRCDEFNVLFKTHSCGESACVWAGKTRFLFDFNYGFVKHEWKKYKKWQKEKLARYKTDGFIRNRFFHFPSFAAKHSLPTSATSLQASKLRDGEKTHRMSITIMMKIFY